MSDLYVRMKVLLDKADQKDIEKINQDIQNKFKPLNLNVKANTDVIKRFEDANKQVYKVVKTITNELGQQEQITYRKNEFTGRVVTTNYKKQREEIEKMTEAMNKGLLQSQLKSRAADRQAELKQAQAINKALEERYKLSQRLNDFQQRMLGIGELKGEIDIFAEKYKGRYDESALTKLRTDIEGLNSKTPELNQKIKEATISFSLLKRQASEAGSVFTRMFENAFKFMRFYLVGGFLVRIFGEFKQSIDFIKELDKDLTEISMVTGMAREETASLAQEYAKLGAEMGKTVTEISAVNKELIRQGLTLDVARERMEAILKLSSTARISTTEALELITSGVNAMKESAETVSDVLLKAGAVSASSAAQIGEAFTKTASSAKSTGVSIESLTAMLATMIEVTQESPSSLGNSMKTLLSRFNRVNTETGELNTNINDVQKAFESVNVEFLNAEGQIRPVDDLLADLSLKWNTLNKNTKMYIATQAAGTRQQNRFLAIMENYSRVQEISNELMEAAGTTNQQYAKWLKSTEAAANRAQNAMHQFYINAIDSDTIRSFYNVITLLINGLDTLVNNSFAQFGIQIGVITASIALLNKGLVLLKGTTLGSVVSKHLATVATKGWAAANTTLIGTVRTLTASLLASPLFWTVAATTVIYGIIKAVDYLNSGFERQYKVVQGLNREIDELNSKYNELASIENPTEDQENYLSLLKDELETKKALRAIELERQMRAQFSDTKYRVVWAGDLPHLGRYDGIEKYQEDIQKLIELEEQFKNANNSDSKQKFKKEILEIRQELMELIQSMDQYMAVAKEFPDIFTDFPDGFYDLYDSANAVIEATKYLVPSIRQPLEDDGDAAEKLAEKLAELAEAYDDAKSSMQDSISTLKSLHKIQDDLNKNNKLSASSIEEIIDKHENLLPYLDDEIALREKLQQAIIEEEATQIQKYQNMLENSQIYFNEQIRGNDELYSQLKEYYGADADSFKTIAQIKMDVDNHLRKIIGDGWSELYDNTLQGQIRALEQLTRSMESRYRHKENILYNNEDYIQAQDMLKSLKLLTGEIDVTLKSIDFSSVNLSGIKDPSSSPYQSQLEQFYNQLQQISTIESELKQLQEERELLTSQSDINASIQEEIRLQEQLVQLYTELNNIQREARTNMVSSFDQFGDAAKVSDDLNRIIINTRSYNNLSQEQKEKLDDLIKSYNSLTSEINSSSSAINGAKSEIQSLNVEIENIIKSAFDSYYSYIFSQSESSIKQLQKEKKAIQENADAKIKALQDEIDLLQKEERAIKESVDARIDKLQEEKKILEEIAQSRIDTIQAEIDEINKVNDAKKEQEERERRLIEIEELREKLRNARRNKNVQIMQQQADGSWDYEYVADPDEVENLQNQIKQKQEDFDKWERDLRQKAIIDKKREEIQAIRDELAREQKKYDEKLEYLRNYNKWESTLRRQAEIESKQEKIESIREELERDVKKYDDKIEKLQDFISEEKEKLDARKEEQITSLEELNATLINIDSDMYADRISLLDAFIREYNKLATQLDEPTIKHSSSGGSSSGGSSGNPLGMTESDYQKYLSNKKQWEDGVNQSQAAKENQALRDKYNIPSDNFSYDDLKKFDTGGYTGNSEGLAWLDKKEIVLKDFDTSNLLKAVDITRQLFNSFKVPKINNITNNTNQSPSIHIDKLEFPSVRDGKEVIDTLKQLPRLALQYAK